MCQAAAAALVWIGFFIFEIHEDIDVKQSCHL
jgi:hypothetical protein